MQGVSIVRDDGTRGTVVAEETPGKLIVEFSDGTRHGVTAASLVRQDDGSYRLPRVAEHDVGAAASRSEHEEVIIPVVAEELTVETHRVARAKVRVLKRVETREEVVEAPVVVEEIVVERIPVNKVVADVDDLPTVREEADVLVIPLIEEVVVVQKQLLVREEVRVFKRRKTVTNPQTVVLRREVVDIQREDLAEGAPESQETSRTGKEHQP
jgi:uncharacterized protein (TIGR02271 family)